VENLHTLFEFISLLIYMCSFFFSTVIQTTKISFFFSPPPVSVNWNNHIIFLYVELQKQGKRSPNEYSLEIEDSCICGAFLSWHPLKLTMRCVTLLILLIVSSSSMEPDVEGIPLVLFCQNICPVYTCS